MNEKENYKDLQKDAEVAAEDFGEMSREHVGALLIAASAYKRYLMELYGEDK